MPICTKCGVDKPPSGFYADKRRPAGIQSECKVCVRSRNNAHAAKPETKARRRATRYATEDQRHSASDYNRHWYTENRPRANAAAREWRRNNPYKKRDLEQSRRARRGDYFVEHVDRLVLLQQRDGNCGICGKPVDPQRFDVDHIVPIARGGTHCYANTQPAHPACNQSKKNRLMREHRARLLSAG